MYLQLKNRHENKKERLQQNLNSKKDISFLVTVYVK